MKTMTAKFPLLIKTFAGIGLSLFVINGAMANPHYTGPGKAHFHPQPQYRANEYARVVAARPVYQQITTQVPVQSCQVQTVAYRDSRSYTGTIVGGLIGAAVGNELGHNKRNKQVGAIAGGLLGASIGRDVSNRNGRTQYRDEQVCETGYRNEVTQQLIGYDVTYDYHGRQYQTRTHNDPGQRILVDVDVRPVAGY